MEEIENRCALTEEELLDREERLAEYRSRIGLLKAKLQETVGRRLALEGKRTATDKEAQEKNRELLELERRSAQLEQKKLAADLEEKQIIDKLWDSYELSRSAAQAARQPLESVSQANRRASELRRAIAALGNPNLGAIEEYQRVSARYDFLTEQRDDVEKAKRELQKIIADLTKEMEEIFLREFRAIDLHFRETFL
jgi:chromosome segregation protein